VGTARAPEERRLRRTFGWIAALLAAIAAAGTAKPLTLPASLPQRKVTVPILMYHRVGSVLPGDPAITRALTVSPAAFAAEVSWIHANGFHAITPRQLYSALELGAQLPPKPVMITFDDGYRDVLWNAAPLLRRLRMPATAFLITGRISAGDASFLTWSEVRRLEARGFAIGSHTVHHLELPYVPPSEAYVELASSRDALEDHLRRAVQWFAYPSGRYDPTVVSLVRKAGYVLAFTTSGGDVQHAAQPLLLRRDSVYSWTGLAGVERLLG
jgi:peptidoglycan/xylan/chitin deacetylase (PgdA/CDA1 family)